MNIITQESKKRQAVVEYAIKYNNKSKASRQYEVSLSSVKRWCQRYDRTWQSLAENRIDRTAIPKGIQETQIKNSFKKFYARYGLGGVYDDLIRKGFTRSFSGMVYVAKRLGLAQKQKKKMKRREQRCYTELLIPGEKVQIDVKEIPYNCLKCSVLHNEKHPYQWTAINEYTRIRFFTGLRSIHPKTVLNF